MQQQGPAAKPPSAQRSTPGSGGLQAQLLAVGLCGSLLQYRPCLCISEQVDLAWSLCLQASRPGRPWTRPALLPLLQQLRAAPCACPWPPSCTAARCQLSGGTTPRRRPRRGAAQQGPAPRAARPRSARSSRSKRRCCRPPRRLAPRPLQCSGWPAACLPGARPRRLPAQLVPLGRLPHCWAPLHPPAAACWAPRHQAVAPPSLLPPCPSTASGEQATCISCTCCYHSCVAAWCHAPFCC